MSKTMDFNYEQIYQNDVSVLKYLGIVTQENSKYSKIFRYYYYFATIFFLGIVNVLMVINCTLGTDGLKGFADIGYIMFLSVGIQIKSTLLYLNRAKLAALIADLNIEMFQPKEDAEKVTLKSVFSFFKKIRSTLLGSCVLPTSILIILPLFFNGMMIYPCWYPIDMNSSPAFEVIYIHQVISLIYSVIMDLIPDIIVGGLLTFIGLQCDLLSYRIKKLGKVGPVTRDDWVACIQHYKLILRYAENTNHVFGKMYFGQIFTTTIVLCLNLFLLSLSEEILLFLFHFMVIISVAFILFLPCWFATEMTKKSEQISNATYNCNWPVATNSFKKELLIFMACSQRPVKFYAADYFEISVVIFVVIIRSALSYYAVMHNLNMTESE